MNVTNDSFDYLDMRLPWIGQAFCTHSNTKVHIRTISHEIRRLPIILLYVVREVGTPSTSAHNFSLIGIGVLAGDLKIVANTK